jgi:hypothetical protein
VNRGGVLIVGNYDNVRWAKGQAACQEQEPLSRRVDEGKALRIDTQESGRARESAAIEGIELVVLERSVAGPID